MKKQGTDGESPRQQDRSRLGSAHKNRWSGVERPYTREDVRRLQGTLVPEHTLAKRGAEKLWELLHIEPFVAALGALTGSQAVQQVRAGLKAVYVSGWQVAADANLAGHTYPDQSLYPCSSVPHLVKRISQALQRADQIHHSEGKHAIDWFAPIVADAEAGFGGPLNVFELIKMMIDAGAAGVHLEDQLSSEKKCGHMGGKVVLPTGSSIRNLIAARLAADVCNVATILIARTDAAGAKLMTSDIDERDEKFLTGERTAEGFFRLHGGIDQAIARAISYAPYADMVAKLEGPQFSGGANIAIKCPSHTYEQTVAFYRDTLGLPLIEEEKDGCIFQFGPNRLWIDSVPNLSHPDVWLELETNDTEAAASFLKVHGVSRRDEVEQLRDDFNGFFISAPNGVIHLVVGPEEV